MKSRWILLFALSLLLVPGQSFALSCAEPLPVDIAADNYDGILIGSVRGIESTNGAKKLTIDVEKSFKGVNRHKITVHEDITWGESQEGATYLFFLKKDKDKWVHPLCSPSTYNTDLAEEHFGDQEEIPLQAVELYAYDSDNTLATVMIATLLLGILAAIIWILSARKRKNA
ncbi:hypothetical protein [Planococcus sp. CAU13]|uniref:hypothetical protein n=1 Tax=Planococcus sp. CAU13 TaxID=1541197 RepID=UPI00052FDC18|nr:hypothetical protein [Planococcus sp. CAU13]